MKTNQAIIPQGSLRFFVRQTRQIIFSVAAFVVAMLFVLVACSAPQNNSGQANNQQQGAATGRITQVYFGVAIIEPFQS